jgi:hypothetical protein
MELLLGDREVPSFASSNQIFIFKISFKSRDRAFNYIIFIIIFSYMRSVLLRCMIHYSCFMICTRLAYQVAGHARQVQGSLRRMDESRKQQREVRAERKARERRQREEELKRLRNIKKREVRST